MTYRDMSDMTRIQYLRSEIVVSPTVYQAATNILVAYINNKMVSDANLKEMLEKAVKTALELAITTDKVINESGTRKPGLK